MHRYYMDSQTRDALIVESNRLIAIRAANAASGRNAPRVADTSWTPPAEESAPDTGAGDLEANSAFAALVSELRSVSTNQADPQREHDVAR